MAIQSSIEITGYINNLAAGRLNLDTIAVENSASISSSTELACASGDNTITIPTGARGVIITFPTLATTTKRLKGVAGDTGIQVDTTTRGGSFYLLFGASPGASFVINSSALDTLKTQFQFF